MKKIILSFVLVLTFSVLATNVANAQTTSTPAEIQAKIDSINQLNQQIKALVDQLNELSKQQQANVVELVRYLRQGSTGDDVKIIQAILAADSVIYPEGLITGFYGNATTRAIAKFQAKHGIDAVGFVGPRTLAKLKEVRNENNVDIEEDEHGEHRACAKVPPGHLIAPGWLRKHDGEKPIVPTCQKLPEGISKKINGDFKDLVAPVISAVNSSDITATSAKVTWTTNENSTSKVYYGTANPLVLDSALTVKDSSLVTSHSVNLTGLASNTAYYFVVESKDSSKNTATGTQQTFVTLAVDTTMPTISAIATTSMTTTGITIMWVTDEPSDSKVYYSTTTPVDTTTAPNVSDSALVTNHSLGVTGLTANTTYYFVIKSKDGSNNTATSSEQTFTTPSS